MLDSFSTHVNKHKPNIYYFSAWEQLFKLCAGLLTSDTLTSEHLCLFTVPALGTLVSLFGPSLQLTHSPAAPPMKSDKAGASADLRSGPMTSLLSLVLEGPGAKTMHSLPACYKQTHFRD